MASASSVTAEKLLDAAPFAATIRAIVIGAFDLFRDRLPTRLIRATDLAVQPCFTAYN